MISADFWYLRKRKGKILLERDDSDGEEEVAQEEESPEEESAGEARTNFLKKPILVLWEARSRALFCLMLPTKALSDTYGPRHCVRTIDRKWGFLGQRIVLREDGEPALQALLEEIGTRHAGAAAGEVSPAGDHQANGAAELNRECGSRKDLRERFLRQLPSAWGSKTWTKRLLLYPTPSATVLGFTRSLLSVLMDERLGRP